MVRNASAHGTGKYAFAAFSALSKYIEYYISYPAVHVYSTDVSELVGEIPKGRGDTALHVLGVDFEIILKKAWLKGEFAVVGPIQVVVDLFGLEGAGRDGAMKLYVQIVEGKLEKCTTC